MQGNGKPSFTVDMIANWSRHSGKWCEKFQKAQNQSTT